MSEAVTGSKLGITLAAMCAAVMALLDISIVNVALTDIRATYGIPLDQIGWVSTSYMMANIVIIPMTGWLQRRYGYRNYFCTSVLGFTIASALCGCAWNLPSLVVFRVLQGLGGGAIIPTAQNILFARYDKAEHGKAAGIFGLGAVCGPLLGPTVGGHLIDIFDWHAVFLINVPIGILVVLLAFRTINQPHFAPARDPVDRVGILLLAVSMASLQYALEEGNRENWFESATITGLSAIAAIGLPTFVIHELETPHPIVDFRVFANVSYAAATSINFLLGMVVFSAGFVLSLMCGALLRYSALNIGTVFLAAASVQLFGMPLVGGLSAKVDPRKLLLLGLIATMSSLWLNGRLTYTVGYWDITLPFMLRAGGLAFIFIPITLVAVSDLPAEKRGNATALFSLTRELGGSIGTAWMGLGLANGLVRQRAILAEHVTAFNPLAIERYSTIQGVLNEIGAASPPAVLAVLRAELTREAMVRTFNDAFQSAALLFILAIPLVVLLKPPVRGSASSPAH